MSGEGGKENPVISLMQLVRSGHTIKLLLPRLETHIKRGAFIQEGALYQGKVYRSSKLLRLELRRAFKSFLARQCG